MIGGLDHPRGHHARGHDPPVAVGIGDERAECPGALRRARRASGSHSSAGIRRGIGSSGNLLAAEAHAVALQLRGRPLAELAQVAERGHQARVGGRGRPSGAKASSQESVRGYPPASVRCAVRPMPARLGHPPIGSLAVCPIALARMSRRYPRGGEANRALARVPDAHLAGPCRGLRLGLRTDGSLISASTRSAEHQQRAAATRRTIPGLRAEELLVDQGRGAGRRDQLEGHDARRHQSGQRDRAAEADG